MSRSDARPASTATIEEVDAVGAALAGIENLDGVPLAEHVARFDAVHGALAQALSAIDGT